MPSRTRHNNSPPSTPIQEETISYSFNDSSKIYQNRRKRCKFLPEISCCFVLFCISLSIVAFVLGFAASYLGFKLSLRTSIPSSTSTTVLTSSSTTISTSSQSTIITATSPSTSTTTSSSSNIPTTTTTSFSNPASCPPVLPQPNHSNILLSLDDTMMSDFHNYSIEYVSPVNASASIAMLMFEFITVWGSWYLDDVSIKESHMNGEEMIDNGGFETSNLGSKWKFCDARYSWITDAMIGKLHVHSGNYSYESKDLDVGSDEYLTQVFDIQSNTIYTIEFYLSYIGQPSSVKVTVVSD